MKFETVIAGAQVGLLLAASTSLVVGCAEGDLATLSGEVRYQDVPIANGGIRLFPRPGTPGHGAAVAITDGRYAFASPKELFAGKYRVEMVASRPTGRKIKASESLDGREPAIVDEYELVLPERFNVDSTMVIDVLPGANSRNFFLTDKEESLP